MAEQTADGSAAAPPPDGNDDAPLDDVPHDATPGDSAVRDDGPGDGAHGGLGDTIHMPPNSYWPLVTAIGVAVTLVGLIPILENPIGFIVGLVILLAGIGGWVRDARKEYKELH